jgi:hypothetical protein
MTSNINPNNINGAYPVAGQDNNSQGFRDNFTNTKNNFQYAANEITDLQNKVIVSSALTGGQSIEVQNNMLGAPLINAVLSDTSTPTVALGVLSGSVVIDFAAGHFQTVTTGASLSLDFTNLPPAGQTGSLQVQFTVTNAAYTITLPAAVSINTAGMQGFNNTTNVITFNTPGVYTFGFITADGGTSILFYNLNLSLAPFNTTRETITTTGANVSLGSTTTQFDTTTGAQTSTLIPGVGGSSKIFQMTAYGGNMVMTVTQAGWVANNASGTATFSAKGQGCTMRYSTTSSAWYCVGNNGVTFG